MKMVRFPALPINGGGGGGRRPLIAGEVIQGYNLEEKAVLEEEMAPQAHSYCIAQLLSWKHG